MEQDHAKDQARAQAETIIELMAAYNLDFERLEELRSERINLAETLADQEILVLFLPELQEEARAALESWDKENSEELKELEHAAGDYKSQEEAEAAAQENALSVEVRSSWHVPGEDNTATDFKIVLCTGGPHVEIMGELSEDGEPCTAWLQYQDWGTPMIRYFDIETETLIDFCETFNFVE